MFDETQKLEISQKELTLIEEALHTQSKILGVQAGAGGSKALTRLNDIKRVLSTIDQQKPVKRNRRTMRGGFFKMSRLLG